MGDQVHYFLAVPLDAEVKKWLCDRQKALQKEGIEYQQWTGIDDFHITLKFFGATKEETKKLLTNELQKFDKPDPFQLTIGDLGWFGLDNKPRVIWTGVESSSELLQLHKQIEISADKVGFKQENRDYRPHITLGKKWCDSGMDKIRFEQLTKLFKERKLILVDRFVLYRIYPSSTPKYQEVSEFKL